MKILISSVLLFIFIFYEYAGAWNEQDLKEGKILSQSDLSTWLKNNIIEDKTNETLNWIRNYPDAFKNGNIVLGYYQAGEEFLKSQKRMMALKAFLTGFNLDYDLTNKALCAYYAAKIFYQQLERESSLFYLNRALEILKPSDPLRKDAEDLKKRIRWEYISRKEGIPNDSISGIEFDGDDLWIATWSGGVIRYTRSANSLTLFEQSTNGLISRHIRDILLYENKAWIATVDGLCAYNKKTGVWEKTPGKLGYTGIKKLTSACSGFYAATLGKGLFKRDLKGNWQMVFSNATHISDLVCVSNRLIIAALNKGIYFQKGTDYLNVLTNLSIKAITLYQDKLYAGTYGYGVYELSTDGGILRQLTVKDGLSSDFIECIEIIGNSLFFGTLGGGVSIYKPDRNQWTRLTITDGLPSNDVMRIKREGNKIWFGTLSGGIGILLSENMEDF